MVRHIENALTRTRGQIEGPSGAAARLAINPHTLRSRMRKLGIDWRSFAVKPFSEDTRHQGRTSHREHKKSPIDDVQQQWIQSCKVRSPSSISPIATLGRCEKDPQRR